MKLHLPKLLRVAVLAAMPLVFAASAVAENVDLSSVSTTYEHTGDLTLGTNERMGRKDGETWIKIADKISKKQSYTGLFTPGVKVTGTLKLTSTARADVGGLTDKGYYDGITADSIIVQDSAELYTYKVSVRELEVSGGIVQIHYEENGTAATYGPYGNTGTTTDTATSKQVHIKEALTVTGGSVKIGSSQSDENTWSAYKHIQTVFGYGSTTGGTIITQTDGTLDIQGKTATKGNLVIEQTGGTMDVVTKTTKVINNAANGPRLLLANNSVNRIRQSGTAEGLTMTIGRVQSYSSSNKVAIHILQESQSGTISLTKGVSVGSSSPNSSIALTGGGSVQLTGDYSGAVFDVSLMKGKLSLTDSSTKLKSSVMAIASGAQLANSGIIQVGTGTAGTKAGGLYVTSGGTFGVVANSSVQSTSVLTVGATGCNVTEWTMASGSTFGIGFTDEWVDSCYTGTMTQTTGSLSFDFDLQVATGLANTTGLENTFGVIDMDEAHWSISSAAWNQTGNETSVKGTLIYNPWVKVNNGGEVSEDFSDTTDTLLTGLDISTTDVTLSGDNTHSLGTRIDGVKVTLGHANALGSGTVTTEGETNLSTADGVTVTLTDAIVNKGTLMLTGSYDVAALLESKEILPDNHITVDGEIGNDGFRQFDRFSLDVVSNEDGAVLDSTNSSIMSGTLVGTMDDVSGEASFVGGVEYSLYTMENPGHSATVSRIQEISGGTTNLVTMSAGTLTADADMTVGTSGGTLVAKAGVVSGEIVDTTVKATGGEIAAAIRGTSSVTVTGETVVSGENDYSGGTLISGKDARLVLKSGSTLGSGVIQLDDHASLDLGQNAIANNIKVTGCELHNASAYTGDIEVSGNLTICGTDATANKVTLIEGGSIAASADENLTVGTLVVDAGSTISAGTTVTRSLVLNNGAVLTMNGDLTLADGTVITLNGADFVDGQTIISSTGTITMGDVKLECADSDIELELVGNTVVLVLSEPAFDQNKAIACTLSNWGIATASRAFVNAVRGQRNNTGCIANGRGTAWVAVLGGTNEIDGSDIKLEGAAFGADMKVGAASNVGIAFGYVEGEVQPTGLRTVDQEGAYVALYGEHGLKKLGSTSCLSMDWVAAYGTTESDVDGLGWEQDSVQLNSRLNWNKKVTDRLCMSVFGGLEYFASNSDTVDGVKTGSIQNLRGEIGVGARYVAWGTPSTTDSKSGMLLNQGCEKLVLHGELRYMNDMVRSNPVIRMNGMSGMGDNPGRQGMGIEAGATYRFGERWSASANYGFNTMEDSKEHRVNVGASYTF